VLPPSLPPRWQRCPPVVGDPPIVGRGCERKKSSHSILPLCSPEMCPRVSLGYTKTKGIFAATTAPSTPEVAANPKKAKAPLRPPYKSRRGLKRGRSGLVSAGSVRLSRESRRRWDRRSGSRSFRVWVRSILLCPEDVKKKCAVYHKIFGRECLLCLQVVVAVRRATRAFFAADCARELTIEFLWKSRAWTVQKCRESMARWSTNENGAGGGGGLEETPETHPNTPQSPQTGALLPEWTVLFEATGAELT